MHSLLHKKPGLGALALVLVLALALLLGAGAAAAAGLVTLRDAAVVEDEVVRLSDLFEGIADPALAETPIAQAPEPGVSVDIGARWLYAVARAHALAWEPRSRYERLTLRRASQDVPAEAIEAALREALAEQGVDGEVQLALDNPDPRLRLPSDSAGGLRIARLTLDPSNGRFVAQAVAPAVGEPQARLSITGRALALTEVPVLKSDVKPGEVIREHDVEWMSVPANRLTRTTVTDSADLIGMTPRRPIRAQQVIRSTELETPVMVAKNSLVVIRLRTDRMQLTVQGRALEDGAAGEVVRVMNTQSNTVISAVVVGSGAVEVVPARITAQR